MDFFGLGFGEILLIMIVALLVFGPARIPEIARTIGRTVRSLRQFTSNFTTAVTKELELEEQRSHQPPAIPAAESGQETPGNDSAPQPAGGKGAETPVKAGTPGSGAPAERER